MIVVLIKHILCCFWEVPTMEPALGLGNIVRDLAVGKSLQRCNNLTCKPNALHVSVFVCVCETLYITTTPSNVSCDV